MIVCNTNVYSMYDGFVMNEAELIPSDKDDVFDIGNINAYKLYQTENINGEHSILFIFKGIHMGNNSPVTIGIPLFTFNKKPDIMVKPKQSKKLIIDELLMTMVDEYIGETLFRYFDMDSLIKVNKYVFGKLWIEYFEGTDWEYIINR